MKRRPSLFRRTAVTVAAGLLMFQLIAAVSIFVYLVFPLAHRSAEDMASLLVWSGRAWLASPEPTQRSLIEKELRNRHGISLRATEQPLPENFIEYPYMFMLRTALKKRLPFHQPVYLTEARHEKFQVEFYLQNQRLHFEFAKDLLVPRPSLALLWVVSTGFLVTLLITWILARRVTAPVAGLATAAKRIGHGDFTQRMPEPAEAELAELTRVFNETARQLQERQENQTTLLAGISHDLRSPLARMKMALGLLTEQAPSPLVERIERDISEMDTLIGAQLELARAQEREQAEWTDIYHLLNDLLDAAEAQAPGRLTLQHCPKISVELAPLALRRCLDNMIGNALRYSDGSVDIVCRQFNRTLYFAVRDRGPGIPVDRIEAVFRPFYRLESSRSRSTGGSGLGLAITRQLADTQGWHTVIRPRWQGGINVWIVISLI